MPFGADQIRALSSEVETGSRQENASNQESRAPFRFYRNGIGSRLDGNQIGLPRAGSLFIPDGLLAESHDLH